jgi:hypothetical protein
MKVSGVWAFAFIVVARGYCKRRIQKNMSTYPLAEFEGFVYKEGQRNAELS